MAQLKDFQTGAVGDSFNGPVGTSTAAAGAFTTLAASGSVTLSGGTANGVTYLNGSKVLTSSNTLVFNGSTLGVGISSPAGVLAISSGNTDTRLWIQNTTSGTASGDGLGLLMINSDAYMFNYEGPVIFGASGFEGMRLTSTGLGIGTSTPAYKVDAVRTGTGDVAKFTKSGGQSGYIYADSAGAGFFTGAGATGAGMYAYTGGLEVSTNSTVKATLDNSGNLGLGVTPSANFMLEAGSTASAAARSFKLMTLTGGFSGGNYPLFGYNFRSTATSGVYKYDASDTASAINYSGAMSFLIAPSGTAGNNITWTTAMTLDADGDLGVGITSPLYKIHSSGTVARKYTTPGTTGSPAEEAGFVYADDGSTPVAGIWFFNTFSSGNTTQMAFKTRNSAGTVVEAVRIDASQNLLVGTTSSIGGKIQVVFDGTAGDGVGLKTNNATLDAVFIRFINSAGSTAGRIYQNGTTSVSYVTSSDKRLKIDNGIATDTNVIDNAIVHDYQWKSNNKIERGLFAQEAYENKPESVFVGDDELTEDGSLKNPWGIDYSKYVPDLIVHAQQLKKQVQEQQAIIESLKARLDAANL